MKKEVDEFVKAVADQIKENAAREKRKRDIYLSQVNGLQIVKSITKKN